MNASEIVIDPEFKKQIPSLTKQERDQLKQNILAEGCRDPLVVWMTGNILLDGHNRYEICITHGLPFDIKMIDLSDRDTVADWIDKNQLGRRNLTKMHRDLLIGRIYNRAKKREGAPLSNTNHKKSKLHQNDGVKPHPKGTAKLIGDQHGIGSATVERAGRVAEAVDVIIAAGEKVDPDLQSKIVQGTAPSKENILNAAEIIKTKIKPERPKPTPKPTPPPVTQDPENTAFLDWVDTTINDRRELRKIYVIAAMYGSYLISEAGAEEFWGEISRGKAYIGDVKRPTYVLAKELVEAMKPRFRLDELKFSGALFLKCVKAWNAYCDGQSIDNLKVPSKKPKDWPPIRTPHVTQEVHEETQAIV